MPRFTRIGLTGAHATVGRVLLDGLSSQYDVVSNNGRRVFDLEQTRTGLGFVPQDDAETHFARLDA